MDQNKTLIELFESKGIEVNRGDAQVQKNDIAAEIGNPDAQVRKNANEVMHTGNTGYGAELVPLNVLAQKVYEAIPTLGSFLGKLPGFHGSNLAVSEKVSVIGDPGYFQKNAEWTTGAGAIAQGNTLPPTAEVTITQVPLILSVDISKRELNHSIVDLQNMLTTKIAAAAAQTCEGMIVNCDSEGGATGNVNLDDADPDVANSATYWYQLDHGLRELAINGTSLSVNVGTLALDDILGVMAKVGKYASIPQDCMFLFESATSIKALGISELASAAISGRASTIQNGILPPLFGSECVVHKAMPKTEADGKISTTAGNNTLGQFLYFYKPAIQWGYGQPLEFDVFKVPGKGVQLIATMEFGFAISQLQAGNTSSSVGIGINVTL